MKKILLSLLTVAFSSLLLFSFTPEKKVEANASPFKTCTKVLTRGGSNNEQFSTWNEAHNAAHAWIQSQTSIICAEEPTISAYSGFPFGMEYYQATITYEADKCL